MSMIVCLDCGTRYNDVLCVDDCPHESLQATRCSVCGFRGDHPDWCSQSDRQPTVTLGKWVKDALCARFDYDLDHAGWINPDVSRMCASCPVRLECAQYAIAARIDDGLWGGLRPDDRRKVRNGVLTLEEAFLV